MVPNTKEHRIPVIYLITCKVNGKIYVGSAKNFYKRYNGYKCTYVFENRLLARAMRKHGFDQFEFSILEKVSNGSVLTEREQYYIDELKACQRDIGYNVAPLANSSEGVKHSREARYNMSVAHLGKTQSEETKRRRVASFRENGGYLQVSKAKSKAVVQIDRSTFRVIKEFSSIIAAAKALGRPDCVSTISGVCNRNISTRTALGYYWCFKSEYNILTYKPLHAIHKMSTHFYDGVRPIWQMNHQNEIIALWESASDVAMYFKGNKKSGGKISACCSGRQKLSFGFRWMYVQDPYIIDRVKDKRRKEYDNLKVIRDNSYGTS